MNGKGIKRKKKSFLQRTLKFYKNGSHGQGVHINEEAFEYFLHVLKILKQEFDSDEDKKIFVENVFQQIKENEVNYSCNQVVSRIIDSLLPWASNDNVIRFINAFDLEIRRVSTDPFASFVFQKLIIVATNSFFNNNNETEDSNLYHKWLLKIFKFVLNNIEEFIFDNFANHVMRTVIVCSVGQTSADCNNITKSHLSSDQNIDEEFIMILKNFTKQLLKWKRFSELPYENLSSGFLQVLIHCIALIDTKLTKKICKKLVNDCYTSSDLSHSSDIDENKSEDYSCKINYLFTNESYIRLLESIISVVPAKIFTKIYLNCFANKLLDLAQNSKSNFAVQKLICYCQDQTEFEAIFTELSSCFKEIVEQGNIGVIVQLCEACIRLKTKQSLFMQLWINYLECNESKETQNLIFPLTVFMKKRKDCNLDEENVNLHGSLLVQNMFKFNKPIKVISSMLEMNRDHLVNILCNPKGSHIIDSFFESKFIGDKSREKCIKKLQGSFVKLCTSKHGSRVFDAVWRYSHVGNRINICSELLENESQLHHCMYGRSIAYNISLGAFRHSREDWIKAQNREVKAKKLFADIL